MFFNTSVIIFISQSFGKGISIALTEEIVDGKNCAFTGWQAWLEIIIHNYECDYAFHINLKLKIAICSKYGQIKET